MPRNHSGSINTSDRLQATLCALLNAGDCGVTTADIHSETGSLNVSSDIDALRKNGYEIPKAKYEGRTATGARVYRYTYTERPLQRLGPAPQTVPAPVPVPDNEEEVSE